MMPLVLETPMRVAEIADGFGRVAAAADAGDAWACADRPSR